MKILQSILLFTVISLFTACSSDDDQSPTIQNNPPPSYFPLLNNSSWAITTSTFSGTSISVMSQGPDLTINGQTYAEFQDPTVYSTVNYIREDITTKKVYRNVNGVDELLFDFSLSMGDTIILGDGKTYTVTSIENINVSGGMRKKINLVHFEGTFAGNSETWIEGVGNINHPLKPNYEANLSDPAVYITCSAQAGIVIYNHGIANGQAQPSDCSML